jgi:hypothetical protein
MIALLCDENFNNDILRGLLRRNQNMNSVRAQDVGLSGASDEVVLEWAAGQRRVLITHDVSTLTEFAFHRIRAGKSMSGVVEVSHAVPLRRAIEDILLLAECSRVGEWDDKILYLPLK